MWEFSRQLESLLVRPETLPFFLSSVGWSGLRWRAEGRQGWHVRQRVQGGFRGPRGAGAPRRYPWGSQQGPVWALITVLSPREDERGERNVLLPELLSVHTGATASLLELSASLVGELTGCFPQVEELVGARNPHASDDLLLLLHCLPGPNSAHGNRKYNPFYLKSCFFSQLI